jgi:hypothetical protein
VVFVVKRFCVSKLARFMAKISIACFSPCSLSYFWVFLAKLAKSFFMLYASCSRVSSFILFGSGDGELSSFSGCAAGLPSSLLGVWWVSLILMLASSSSVRTLL